MISGQMVVISSGYNPINKTVYNIYMYYKNVDRDVVNAQHFLDNGVTLLNCSQIFYKPLGALTTTL